MPKGVQMHDNSGDKVYPCPYFPVGAIYMSLSSTNPRAFFGGTWERIANGRVIVGVDESDTDFATAKKTGGYKISPHISTVRNGDGYQLNSPYWQGKGLVGPVENTTGSAINAGVSLLQPYIATYIWTRIK